MFQKVIAILVLIVLAPVNAGQAQPSNFRSLVPPAWPTLALNANKAPSCVFWTPPMTGAKPEYFCAVLVADPSQDEDVNNRNATAVLLAVRIDPATGTVSVGPDNVGPNKTRSIILFQKPDSVTCTVTAPGFGHPLSVQCLYDSVQRVGWNGTQWWNFPYGTNQTGIQGPGPDPGISVTSNFSCVPWIGSRTTTCFGIETFKGPPFQSLCVAGLIDSKFGTPSTPAAPTPAYWATRRLVFKLVGNPNGVAPQEPTPVIKVSGPPGGRLKR
jgi:hypothetical protein